MGMGPNLWITIQKNQLFIRVPSGYPGLDPEDPFRGHEVSEGPRCSALLLIIQELVCFLGKKEGNPRLYGKLYCKLYGRWDICMVNDMDLYGIDFIYIYMLGGWALPLWKMMEWKSVGMMTFPTGWKNKSHVPNHQPVNNVTSISCPQGGKSWTKGVRYFSHHIHEIFS